VTFTPSTDFLAEPVKFAQNRLRDLGGLEDRTALAALAIPAVVVDEGSDSHRNRPERTSPNTISMRSCASVIVRQGTLSPHSAHVMIVAVTGMGRRTLLACATVGQARSDRLCAGHQEVELVRAAMGALDSRLGSIALTALLETCRKLRLPQPALPS
jgi:hypothetical protein